MNPERLWAKSWNHLRLSTPPRSAHFAEHLQDVLAAADRVLAATGDDQLRALGLPIEQYSERFHRLVRLAAAIHDLGKANDHFQVMVRGQRDPRVEPQGIRHEWVTILMMSRLRKWLLPAVTGNALDFSIVEWAVAGHHPAVDHQSPPKSCPPGAGVEICLQFAHKDFREALRWLQTALGVDLGLPPEFDTDSQIALTGAENAYQALAMLQRSANQVWDSLVRSHDRRLVPAVKNCLIAADIAGSALPKQSPDNVNLWNWIDQSFDSHPRLSDLRTIAAHRLQGNSPRRFQTAVSDSKTSVTYVKAGCGSGKTLAAYLWAAENHPQRRLYFCYPTTGTATEGFKDYLFPPEAEDTDNGTSVEARHVREVGARLFHSRRDIDCEIILTAGADTPRSESESAIRIDALESWSTPIVACTVDTVLGIVQNNRRGLLGWPALAQAAFVFDEIHAFDDRLFGALLRFLRDLPGLPVLLMTASLPKTREDALRRVLEELRPEAFRQPLVAIPGPAELENLERYHRAEGDTSNALLLAAETFAAGGKVLWVCNTVNRVMDVATRAEALGIAPLIYHSRFRYEDRVVQHKAVIDAFKGSGAALAICSQVAEMSLDISADLLVTELAPVPALIQRLGRLNRRAQNGDPTKPYLIVEPESHLPYTAADSLAAHTWLAELEKLAVASQSDLASLWEQTENQPLSLIASAWLDGGPTTTVTELREASPGISVLLESDQKAAKDRPRDLGRFVLPMPPPPREMNWKDWPRERGIPVAQTGTITYDKQKGAQWRRKT